MPNYGYGYGYGAGPPQGADLDAIRAANRQALGMGAPLDMGNFATNLFNQTVNQVTFKTAITPEMTYSAGTPGQPASVTNTGGGPGEFILRALQPDLEISTPGGVVTVAPYGIPQNNYFWPVLIGMCAVGGALAYYALRGVHVTHFKRRASNPRRRAGRRRSR